MKRIFSYFLILAVIGGITACKNQLVSFDNFEYSAVYFPLQSPVRVLSPGPGLIPNEHDQNLEFNIGVSIGGMYENKKDWSVSYELDPSLANNLTNAKGDPIQVLPSSYYSMSPENEVTIERGSFNGKILVELEDSFFDDTLAWNGNNYVIPLSITSSDADSILAGEPVVSNPVRTKPSDWVSGKQPKNYTLFGIRYINEYHGKYLHRGVNITYDGTGSPIDTTRYSAEFIIDNTLWTLTTHGRNSVVTDGIAQNSGSGYHMKLTFTDNNDITKPADGPITISSVNGAQFSVSGSGTYETDGGEWGGRKRDAIYLEYEYDEGGNTHQVTDTLIFRNRNLTFQEFNLTYNN